MPKLLARITFSRHEETNYTGIGRDITDRGVERARMKGRAIAKEKGAPVFYAHSPRERARGTAESIAEGVQEALGDDRAAFWMESPGLRSTDFYDEEFRTHLQEVLGDSQEAWAKAHYNRPEYYNNPGKLETNEDRRARLYDEMGKLLRFLEKQETQDEVPHLVFVSHYELITLFLDDVFGINAIGGPDAPTFGEHIDIDVQRPLPNGDVPMQVHYNGHTQRVVFDRQLRRVVAP